jgi:hypothetical protein
MGRLWRTALQKVTRPGDNRAGRFSTGVDEAPVLDANPREAFSSEVDSGSREENASNKKKRFRAKWHSGSREENASNKKKRFQDLKWLA